MRIEVKAEDIYIPRWNNNRGLPEDEQIKITHRFLLGGERKKYIYTKPMQADKFTGELDSKVDYIQDGQGIAKAIVTKIEGLEVACGDKVVKVDTIEKLYTTSGVNQVLIAEIESAMLLASPEVDKDFLPRPSTST